MDDGAKTDEGGRSGAATTPDDVAAAVRDALRRMGLSMEDFELRLFPPVDFGGSDVPERVLSIRRLPTGEPRLFLVADDVPWLTQLVADLGEGRL